MFKDKMNSICSLTDSFTLKGSLSEQVLFNFRTMEKYSLDRDQFDLLLMFDGRCTLKEILKYYDEESQPVVLQFIRSLLDVKAVCFDNEATPKKFTPLSRSPRLKSIHFELTSKCNMRCLHCYQETYVEKATAPDLSLQEIRVIIQEMKKMNVEKVGISGGEPLMRTDLFEIIGLLEESEIAVSSILTNGLRLTEKMVSRLQDLKSDYSIFVSLDGMKPSSMKLRGFTGGQCDRVLDILLNNIRNTVSAKIPVMINTAVNTENVDNLEEMYDWLREKGVAGWRIALPKIAGAYVKNHSHFEVSRERERAFSSYLQVIKKHLRNRESGINNFQLQIEHFFRTEVFDNLEVLSPESFVCDYEGKKESCCIKPNGDVTPCPLYIDLVVGNTKCQSLEKIWYSKGMQDVKGIRICDIESCKSCSLSSICATGCRANANFLHGSIYAHDEDACFAVKFFIKEVLPELKKAGISLEVIEKIFKEKNNITEKEQFR